MDVLSVSFEMLFQGFVWGRFMWIIPSSMKMENHPSITCRLKIVFIIIWKVAGELVSPKNITVGSNSPSGVRKAAFHLSPGLMRMLLYP